MPITLTPYARRERLLLVGNSQFAILHSPFIRSFGLCPVKRDSLIQRLLFFLAGALGKALLGAYFLTVRIRKDKSARIFAGAIPPGPYPFWHSHQLPALWVFRRRGVGVVISASRDGEYVARIAASLGFIPIRGSSSRGGREALAGMIRFIESGGSLGITPDGPRGPRYSIGYGALAAARATGRPVTPFAIGLSRFWELKSWDRFRIPKPFSRAVLMAGKPVPVPADADDAMMRALAERLREEMMQLEREADEAARTWR